MIRRPSRRRGTTQRRPPVTARTINFFFFFSVTFQPPKRGKIRPFLGRLIFFRPFMHAGGCIQKKEKNGVQLKKHRRFQKNCRLRHRTPLTVRAIIRTFTYSTEEVSLLMHLRKSRHNTLLVFLLVEDFCRVHARHSSQHCFPLSELAHTT